MTPTVDGAFIDPNEIGEGELTHEQRIYKENILDHYRNPRNKTKVENATHRARDKNPLCGDEIAVELIVRDGIVEEIGFSGSGCAISQAAMSMVSRKIKGMKVAEVEGLGQEYVLALLRIPIGIVRRKCALLGLRVAQQALGKELSR